jgi:MscS family membrane protein
MHFVMARHTVAEIGAYFRRARTDAMRTRTRWIRPWCFQLVVVGVLGMGGAALAKAESGAGPNGGVLTPEDRLAKDSPRASLARFLDLCRAGDFDQAARYLDLPPTETNHGSELARHLKSVLDRYVWFDLDTISPLPGGNLEDGLPPTVEEIASIPVPGARHEPVRLVRHDDGADRWVFARATVKRIDAWYAHLDGVWLNEYLPARLLRPGPRDLLYWQWIALPLLLLAAWLLGVLLSRLTRRLLGRLAARTAARWDDELLARVGSPLTLAWTLALMYLALPWLGLHKPAEDFVHRILHGGFVVIFFWTLVRAVDVARQVLVGASWTKDHPAARALLPLGARVGKVLVFVLAVVALLSELGYSVTSLVAGLGIGGLAVALAAQKTVENLFGAFSIGADQPFREGDFVRIEDLVGTVEAIGLRSTRIRTLDRTLVSIPNGKLADMRLESFSARDRMRLACTIGVVYETSATQMREVLDGLERVLREHPKIWPDAVIVRFASFGDSSLNIDVMAWFQTRDWNEFQVIRQDVLLQFMAVVEKAGSSFAFPTRTIHVVGDQSSAKA